MEKIQPISIRMPESLYNKIKNDADKDKRSVSKQVIYMLEKYYEIKDNIK